MLLLYNPNHWQDVRHCSIDFYDPLVVAIYLKSSALNTLAAMGGQGRSSGLSTQHLQTSLTDVAWGVRRPPSSQCVRRVSVPDCRDHPGLVSGRPNLTALRGPERPRAGAGVHNGRPGGRGPGPC